MMRFTVHPFSVSYALGRLSIRRPMAERPRAPTLHELAAKRRELLENLLHARSKGEAIALSLRPEDVEREIASIDTKIELLAGGR